MSGPKRCGAKTRAGTPCRLWAQPNGRCHLHGGRSLGGIASPTFKHGRYSKYLPARLAERYEEAMRDPQLLALRDDVALLDSRLAELVARVDTGESGALWARLRAAHGRSLAARDTAELRLTLGEMGDLIRRGAAGQETWAEIGDALDQRRRLVESERRRLVEMHQVITVERAMVLLAAVTDVIRRNVDDREVLARVSAELGKLLAAGAGQQPG